MMAVICFLIFSWFDFDNTGHAVVHLGSAALMSYRDVASVDVVGAGIIIYVGELHPRRIV